MCYSKLSSLLNSPSHDVRTLFQCPTKSGCKGSANRMKYQIYLSISEMPLTFRLRSRLKLVQTERKCKFICDFPPTRYESVGCLWLLRAANVVCDDGNFSFLKECDLSLATYLQAAKQINLGNHMAVVQLIVTPSVTLHYISLHSSPLIAPPLWGLPLEEGRVHDSLFS